MLEIVNFLELECVRLANQSLSILVTRTVGPRIIALQLSGDKNLFAELPDVKLDCPGRGQLTLWGGHRLWHAPEEARRTYLPDDRPPAIVQIDNGLLVTQPVEEETGIQKSMTITLPDHSVTVIIDHTLKNQGSWPVELAPWAITQVKPGGVAILPQRSAPSDPAGLLPNRQLTLWPYTDINSPHITWGNRFIFISATMPAGALKIGFPNPEGWLAYYNNHTLFVKEALFDPQATYFDHGSSSECYCNDRFLELETLGPRGTISPGEEATHREVWHVYGEVNFSPTEAETLALADGLGLSNPSVHLEKG
jgi:hypothetical protein